MRVLLVTHEASLSGAPRIAQLVARTLSDLGHEVRTLSRRPGPLADGFRAGGWFAVEPLYRVRRRLARRPWLDRLTLVLDTVLAAASILRHRPDLVYLNSTASAVYLRPALWLGRPVVVHSHESAEVAMRFLGPARAVSLLPRARLIACSPSVVGALAGLAGVPAASVTLLPSVPDAARVRESAALRPAHAFGTATIVVGCCGTVEHRKGADLWLAAIDLVRAALPDADLRFVWVGPPAATAPAEAADSEMFVGPVANPYAEMNRFDIAVLPSRDDPFPLTVLEAMVLGKPVVAFAVGGVPEQIGDAGVVVPPEDVTALAEALIALIVDPVARADLGRLARQRVETLYSVNSFASVLTGALIPSGTAARSRQRSGTPAERGSSSSQSP